MLIRKLHQRLMSAIQECRKSFRRAAAGVPGRLDSLFRSWECGTLFTWEGRGAPIMFYKDEFAGSNRIQHCVYSMYIYIHMCMYKYSVSGLYCVR